MSVWGKVAYEAYVKAVSGLNVHGEKLPAWEDQALYVRLAWNEAAQAVRDAAVH